MNFDTSSFHQLGESGHGETLHINMPPTNGIKRETMDSMLFLTALRLLCPALLFARRIMLFGARCPAKDEFVQTAKNGASRSLQGG